MTLKSGVREILTRWGTDKANEDAITDLSKSPEVSKVRNGIKNVFNKLLYRYS